VAGGAAGEENTGLRYGTKVSNMITGHPFREGFGVREPTRRYRLRWGTYSGRYVGAIALLVSSAVAIPSGNTYAYFQIVVGITVYLVGWLVLPGRILRRIGMLFPALLGVVALLAGPHWLPLLALPFLAWLFVRERSALAYLAVLPFLAVTVALASRFSQFDVMLPAYAASAAAFVGCAWLARTLSQVFPRRSRAATLPTSAS